MRKVFHLAIALALIMSAVAQSQPAPGTPQTARQALIEMLFSKTPGTFAKHLPEATLTTLQKSGAFAALQQYSLLAAQFETTGNGLETFETGRILLSVDDPKTGKKSEMTVENDSLRGDEDDIELSFETYKDREVQRTPFLPRMTFVMKSETGVWKLNEILITVRLPLADPDFLKSITDGLKARAATTAGTQPKIQMSSNSFGGETPVSAVRTILAAENTYGNRYRATGYTCTLSDLDGFGGGEPNEHQAMLISSGLASGKKFGYAFTLSGCSGSPAASFHLGAVPMSDNNFGQRAYCADQAGVVRYSADGNLATCFASGLPMP